MSQVWLMTEAACLLQARVQSWKTILHAYLLVVDFIVVHYMFTLNHKLVHFNSLK